MAATKEGGESYRNNFLQASNLTEIMPLEFEFTKNDFYLNKNSQKILKLWCAKISPYNIPIYINSFATSPTGLRNQTKDNMRHNATRIAVNRGLIIEEIMMNNGIVQSRFVLKTLNTAPFPFQDKVIITIRHNAGH